MCMRLMSITKHVKKKLNIILRFDFYFYKSYENRLNNNNTRENVTLNSKANWPKMQNNHNTRYVLLYSLVKYVLARHVY